MWSLEDPACRPAAAPLLLPLEELQQALQISVARRGVLLLEPGCEKRDTAECLGIAAHEGMFEKHDLFVRRVSVHRMGGNQLRCRP